MTRALLHRLAVLSAITAFGQVHAGDLVLHVADTGTTHRIPYASISRLAPGSGDIHVRPIADSGVPGDGWCPTAGGTEIGDGPAIVLQLKDGISHRIPIRDSVQMLLDSGDIEATTRADSGVAGDAWCTPAEPDGDTPSVFIRAFTVSPSRPPSNGGKVLAEWQVDGATQCIASATPPVLGWQGNVPTSGVISVPVSGTTAHRFELSCSDANSSATAQRNVVPMEPPIIVDYCLGPPSWPPPWTVRQPSMVNPPDANPEFPVGAVVPLLTTIPILGPVSAAPAQSARIPIGRNRYVGMFFDTRPLAPAVFGTLEWGGATSTPLWVMISRCPGNLAQMTDARCRAYGERGKLTWVIDAGNSPATACPLEPGAEYYITALFSTREDYSITSCTTAECTWDITRAGREN